METSSPILRELVKFLESEKFQTALASKFGIAQRSVYYDAGIQKYLDGYEISSHPDTRKKALRTWSTSSPWADSELCDHHTRYLRFKPERRYVQTFKELDPKVDRCWVPVRESENAAGEQQRRDLRALRQHGSRGRGNLRPPPRAANAALRQSLVSNG